MNLAPIINTLLNIHPALFVLVKTVPAYFLCAHLAKSAKKSRVDRLAYAAVVALYAATVASNIKNGFIIGGAL